MQNKLHNTNYNFKPLYFDNQNVYGDEFGKSFFDYDFNNLNCPKCNNPCFGQKPCNNFPIPPPRPEFRPPCANFPLPPNMLDCSKDNFRYFLIGYLFGSWQ